MTRHQTECVYKLLNFMVWLRIIDAGVWDRTTDKMSERLFMNGYSD